MTAIEHGFSVAEPWIAAYGAFALFICIYFESFGAPLPSESMIVAGTVLAMRGDLSMPIVVAMAWASAVLGDSTGYIIGRIGGRAAIARFGPRIGLTEERVDRLTGQVRRHGFVMVLLARFIWGLRQLNGVLAGSLSMPFARFFPANALGAALWVIAWVTVGHFVATLLP